MWRPVSEDELHRYVDGQLGRGRVVAVEAYLEANPGEAKRIGDYGRLNQLIHEMASEIDGELSLEGDTRLRALVERGAGRRLRLLHCAVGLVALFAGIGLGAIGDAYLRAPAAHGARIAALAAPAPKPPTHLVAEHQR